MGDKIPVETRGGEEEGDWTISEWAEQTARNIQQLIDAYNADGGGE